MIIITFADFKKLALENNKRVYYYQQDDVLDLYYLTEGTYVKSFVNLETIPSKESFLSDALFIGATKLLFRIPEGNGDTKTVSDVLPMTTVVEATITEETIAKEHDLQKDGVFTLQN